MISPGTLVMSRFTSSLWSRLRIDPRGMTQMWGNPTTISHATPGIIVALWEERSAMVTPETIGWATSLYWHVVEEAPE